MYSKLEIKKDEIIVQTGDAEFHPSTANINGRCYFRDLPEHLKSKKPLFKTVDGVDIYNEMDYWTVSPINLLIAPHTTKDFHWGHYHGDKAFSTKDKAEQYVAMNKPYFSGQEIINLCEEIQFHNRIHDRADEDYYAVYVSLLATRLLELSKLKTGSADR